MDTTLTAKVNLLSNCALAIYNVAYNTNDSFDNTKAYNDTKPTTAGTFPDNNSADKDKSTLFCVTCKPGYKAHYFSNKKVVEHCSLIANCKTPGSTANACETC